MRNIGKAFFYASNSLVYRRNPYLTNFLLLLRPLLKKILFQALDETVQCPLEPKTIALVEKQNDISFSYIFSIFLEYTKSICQSTPTMIRTLMRPSSTETKQNIIHKTQQKKNSIKT
jgi:hypothetical protein